FGSFRKRNTLLVWFIPQAEYVAGLVHSASGIRCWFGSFRERNELFLIAGDEGEAAGAPVGFGSFQALARGRDEVPVEVAWSVEWSSAEHDPDARLHDLERMLERARQEGESAARDLLVAGAQGPGEAVDGTLVLGLSQARQRAATRCAHLDVEEVQAGDDRGRAATGRSREQAKVAATFRPHGERVRRTVLEGGLAVLLSEAERDPDL